MFSISDIKVDRQDRSDYQWINYRSPADCKKDANRKIVRRHVTTIQHISNPDLSAATERKTLSYQLEGSQTFDRPPEAYTSTATSGSNSSVSDASESTSPHPLQSNATLARIAGIVEPQGLPNTSEQTPSNNSKLQTQSQESGSEHFIPLVSSRSDACDNATSLTVSSKELAPDDSKPLQEAVDESFWSRLPMIISESEFSNHEEYFPPTGNVIQGDFGIIREHGKVVLESGLPSTSGYTSHVPDVPTHASFEHPLSWLTRFQEKLLYFFPPDWACFVHHIIQCLNLDRPSYKAQTLLGLMRVLHDVSTKVYRSQADERAPVQRREDVRRHFDRMYQLHPAADETIAAVATAAVTETLLNERREAAAYLETLQRILRFRPGSRIPGPLWSHAQWPSPPWPNSFMAPSSWALLLQHCNPSFNPLFQQ